MSASVIPLSYPRSTHNLLSTQITPPMSHADQCVARRSTATSARAARSARLATLQADSPVVPAASELLEGRSSTHGTLVTPSTAIAFPAAAANAESKKRAAPAARRGEHTAFFEELVSKASPPRPTHSIVLAKPSKQKETRTDLVRSVRRGELDGVPSKYAGITDLAEFKRLCAALDAKEIKKREIEELWQRGKIATNASAIFDHVYGRPDRKDRSKWRIRPGAYKGLSEANIGLSQTQDERMLLGLEAEELMAHVIVRCHRRKKGLTESEIRLWARAQVRVLTASCAMNGPHSLALLSP